MLPAAGGNCYDNSKSFLSYCISLKRELLNRKDESGGFSLLHEFYKKLIYADKKKVTLFQNSFSLEAGPV